jgi:hypothetical protein
MTDKPVDLDLHRGMAAQKATELRRLVAEVAANERLLRATQEDLEMQLIAAPAATWEDAADKARYLLSVFAATQSGQDPRRKILIKAVLDDFGRLSRRETMRFARLFLAESSRPSIARWSLPDRDPSIIISSVSARDHHDLRTGGIPPRVFVEIVRIDPHDLQDAAPRCGRPAPTAARQVGPTREKDRRMVVGQARIDS